MFQARVYLLGLLVAATQSAPRADDYDYDSEESNETIDSRCDSTNCNPPNCSCFGVLPNIVMHERPQFVMLTFDDAITVANIDTYRKIVKNRKNSADGQSIKLTFFVCHEYNDYSLTNELYKQGHEIAVHSVSHESNTDLWKEGSEAKWKKEMNGMRTMLGVFGNIPEKEVKGHRAPFLQTAGNVTFRVLKTEGFLYDSSMPTRNFMDPPIWPYTLDHGYSQDCQIHPCPNEKFPGVWEIPMIQYVLKSKNDEFFCSMADACTPQPKTDSETKEFLTDNFLRHYRTNKAPFPVFLHEAWLKDPARLAGYMQFLDEILQKDDVFAVSVRQVVEYMRNPVPLSEFKARRQEPPKACDAPEACSYKNPLRNMKSCIPCPKYYPWVGTPLGKRPPKDFPTYDDEDDR